MADTIDRYQEQLVAVTDQAEQQIELIYRSAADDQITPAEAVALILVIIETATARGSALAEAVAASTLTAKRGLDVLTIGLPTPGVRAQAWATIERTIIARDGVTRITQLMRAEVYDSASGTWASYVRTKAPESKWVRRPEGGGCKVCSDLANGRRLNMATPMWRHSGCRCVQEPVETQPRRKP